MAVHCFISSFVRRTGRSLVTVLISVVLLLPAGLWSPQHLSAAAAADAFDFPVDPPDGGARAPWYASYNANNPYLTDNAPCYNKSFSKLQHTGEDWFRAAGTSVYAVANGRVIYAQYANYPGAVVIIEHSLGNGWINPWGGTLIYSMYGHLSTSGLVAQGTDVVRGQRIGQILDQGSNSHVHFEMRRYGDMSSILICPATGKSSWPGPGYTDAGVNPDNYGYTNPSAWIDGHRRGGGTCAGGTPQLTGPSDGYATNVNQSVTFTWSNVSGCSRYHFESWNTSGSGSYKTDVAGTSLSFAPSNAGLWKWQVAVIKSDGTYGPNPPTRDLNVTSGGSGGSCSGSSPGAEQIYLYQDNHSGQCVAKGTGDYHNGGEIGLSGISSVKVGSNVVAMLCGAENFGAPCSAFLTDAPGFDGRVIQNDQVFSVRVQSRASNYETQDPSRWFAEYYPNVSFNGDPMARKNEGSAGVAHDGDWAGNGPGYGVPPGHFSSRFRRTVDFACGTYQFTFTYDDGGRVSLDGQLIYNDWQDGDHRARLFTAQISAGSHELQVEQYDSNGEARVALDWSTLSGCQPPAVPTLASPTNGQVFAAQTFVQLMWDSAAGATAYYAEYWHGSEAPTSPGWQTDISSPLLTSLQAGEYSWHVKARNAIGESGWSPTWRFGMKPRTPTSLQQTGTLACDRVQLTWDPYHGLDNADGVQIYRNGVKVTTATIDQGSFLDPGVAPSTTYSYTVTAVLGTPDLGAIESAPTQAVSVTTPVCPTGSTTLQLEVGIYDLTDPYPGFTAVGSFTPVHTDRGLSVQVVDGTNAVVQERTVTAHYDPTKKAFVATAQVDLTPGAYLVKVKLSNSLRRSQTGFFQVNGPRQTIVIPRIVVFLGDIDGNNLADLTDYNLLIGCYSELQPPKSCATKDLPGTVHEPTADLNDDGMVNAVDYNLLLRIFSVRPGD
jgi:hypothetical protein